MSQQPSGQVRLQETYGRTLGSHVRSPAAASSAASPEMLAVRQTLPRGRYAIRREIRFSSFQVGENQATSSNATPCLRAATVQPARHRERHP